MLREIKAEVCHVLRVEVEELTICRDLPTNCSQDEFECCRYVTELTVYKADMLIFLDETGCYSQNAMRCYAYSWRRHLARTHKLLVRGQ